MGTKQNRIRKEYRNREWEFEKRMERREVFIDNVFFETGYISLKKCYIPMYDERYKQYVMYAESYYRGGHITILYHLEGKQ